MTCSYKILRESTSCTVERNFIMLGKLLAKITISPQIVLANFWHCMQINYLTKSLSFKTLVYKCNFLQLSLKQMQFFRATKTCPNHNSSAIVAFGALKQGIQHQRYEAKSSPGPAPRRDISGLCPPNYCLTHQARSVPPKRGLRPERKYESRCHWSAFWGLCAPQNTASVPPSVSKISFQDKNTSAGED